MSQNNLVFTNHKAGSHDGKKIRSSHHSKIKNGMADQLREDIDILIGKQRKGEI